MASRDSPLLPVPASDHTAAVSCQDSWLTLDDLIHTSGWFDGADFRLVFPAGWPRLIFTECLQSKREKARNHKHFEASAGNQVKISHMVKLSISEGGAAQGRRHREQVGSHWGQKSTASTYYVSGVRGPAVRKRALGELRFQWRKQTINK